jgi:hypothetical protein
MIRPGGALPPDRRMADDVMARGPKRAPEAAGWRPLILRLLGRRVGQGLILLR